MKLSQIIAIIEVECPYDIVELRTEPSLIYVTLGYRLLDGRHARYILALSRDELCDAVDPAGIVSAHAKIAAADLETAKQSASPLPVWG